MFHVEQETEGGEAVKRSAFYFDVSKLTNGELADLIHELSNELGCRCRDIEGKNWLDKQLNSASLSVRSWSTQHQRNMRGSI